MGEDEQATGEARRPGNRCRTEELRSSRAGCEGASIRGRDGAPAYKGNKERQRQRIFICPSPGAERRRFITGSAAKLHFSRLLSGKNLLSGQQGGRQGLLTGCSPPGTPATLLQSPTTAAWGTGARPGPEGVPATPPPLRTPTAAAGCSLVTSRGPEGLSKNMLFCLGGNLRGKAPALSRGGRGQHGLWLLEPGA